MPLHFEGIQTFGQQVKFYLCKKRLTSTSRLCVGICRCIQWSQIEAFIQSLSYQAVTYDNDTYSLVSFTMLGPFINTFRVDGISSGAHL